MSISIYVEVLNRDGEVIWDSADNEGLYVCSGGDKHLVIYKAAGYDKETGYRLIPLCWPQERECFKNKLDDWIDKLNDDLQHFEELIEDLRCARRYAPSIDAFDDFSERIDIIQSVIDDTDWEYYDKIDDMVNGAVDMLRKTYNLSYGVDPTPQNTDGCIIRLVYSD